MKNNISFLIYLILFLLLVAPLHSVQAQTFSARDLLAAVNALRAANGLAPYQADGGLMAYAQEHSEYQASIGKNTHVHSDGLSPQAYGVTENIASGGAQYLTLDAIIYQIWADSLHMNTMIGYESGFAGVGIAVSGGTVYVTLDVRPGKSAATLAPSGGTQSSGSSAPVGTPVALVPLITATPDNNGALVHAVGYGQSLWSIAIAYGVKIDEIRALNGLAPGSTDIYAGQKLVIRQAGAVTPAPSGEPQAGETPAQTDAPIPTNPPPPPTLRPTETAASVLSDTPAPSTTKRTPIELSGFSPTRLLAIFLILIWCGWGGLAAGFKPEKAGGMIFAERPAWMLFEAWLFELHSDPILKAYTALSTRVNWIWKGSPGNSLCPFQLTT